MCRELQVRYLDIALDAALATQIGQQERGFVGLPKYTQRRRRWRSATPERRSDLLKAVNSGQIAVAAMAMNNTAFLNGPQWQKMLHWLPEAFGRGYSPAWRCKTT